MSEADGQDLTDRLEYLAQQHPDPRVRRESVAPFLLAGCKRAGRQLRSVASVVDGSVVARTAAEVAMKAVCAGMLQETRHELDRLRDLGELDQHEAEELRQILNTYRCDLEIVDPRRWVTAWRRAERIRRRHPTGIANPVLQQQLASLLELIYGPATDDFIRSLSRSGVDGDEIRQLTAHAIFKRFLKADRLGVDRPIIDEDREWAYIKTTLRHQFIDMIGHNDRHAETTAAVGANLQAEGPEDQGPALAELSSLTEKLIHRSWHAPLVFGQAYQAQWQLESNGRARESVARRFAVALILAGWQRSVDHILVPDMVVAFQIPIDEDDGVWLRPSVNRALGLLMPRWADRYRRRMPVDDGRVGGVRGATESTDYFFLVNECRGRTDNRRSVAEPSDQSVRLHGVGALFRLLYGEIVAEALEVAES